MTCIPARCAATVVILSLVLALPAAASRRISIGDGMVATLSNDQEIFLEAAPRRGEGLIAFTRRFSDSSEGVRIVSKANGNPRRLLRGVRYRLPYVVLSGTYQVRVVRALFPADEPRGEGWHHIVPQNGPGHSLWLLAEWFTGQGKSFSRIREVNDLPDNTVPAGGEVLIPSDLLRPAYLATLPPLAVPAGVDYTYDRDTTGEYLVYRLKKGEALYSAVVMRFTGNIFADDVNPLAKDLIQLNRIRDVTDMAIGHKIRVPFDILLPQYLPPEDLRRREYDQDRSESDKYSNTVQTSTLEGITVILDAGHGGDDPGAVSGGVREATYVYDILLRTKKLLETTTAATVAAITRDGDSFQIVDRDKLPSSSGHKVLTHPPYRIADTTIGTHLRWYLANSLHRAATKRSNDALKTVFISIHADSLHKSMRGAMAYIPATSLTKGKYGKSGSVYDKRSEVREQRSVSFSWQERTQSEGLSRQLAKELLASFSRHNLRLHPEPAIRDRVIRCRRCKPWVPAVVRRNAVPAKMLLEVSNLNNSEDRRLLETRAFRQKAAEAIVDGILRYYGEDG
jgi:N-acetylmuramoyl-L-alanine amidase